MYVSLLRPQPAPPLAIGLSRKPPPPGPLGPLPILVSHLPPWLLLQLLCLPSGLGLASSLCTLSRDPLAHPATRWTSPLGCHTGVSKSPCSVITLLARRSNQKPRSQPLAPASLSPGPVTSASPKVQSVWLPLATPAAAGLGLAPVTSHLDLCDSLLAASPRPF